MDIYIGHSSSIDFKERLYRPLRNSSLDDEHNIVLPYEDSDEPFDSKEFLKNECDVFVAEVSEASTGLGIELGWADLYEVPVICIYREKDEISSSLSVLNAEMIEYEDREEMIKALTELIKEAYTE
jgi:hypothetical protein